MLAIKMILQPHDTPHLQLHLCTAIFVCHAKHVGRIWVSCSELEFINLPVFPGFTSRAMENLRFEPNDQIMLTCAPKVGSTVTGRGKDFFGLVSFLRQRGRLQTNLSL